MDDTTFVKELQARHATGEKMKFLFFWGHQPGKNGVTSSCFSQWYESPFTVGPDSYATAEHFMMAEKAALFGAGEIREKILKAPTPGAVKALGRTIEGFDEAVWRAHRFDIVVRANSAKFGKHEALGAYLKQTGDRILVEASPVDAIWGIGLAQDDDGADKPQLWRGLNLLGFALMEVRAQL